MGGRGDAKLGNQENHLVEDNVKDFIKLKIDRTCKAAEAFKRLVNSEITSLITIVRKRYLYR